ncbi:MAG TPA: OmpA family protein [Micropepsaceae bacterium]
MRFLIAVSAGCCALVAANTGFSQPAPQLSPDEIVKALSCPPGTDLNASGVCESVSAPASVPVAGAPGVEICAAPPDVPRVLVRTPDGDCVPAKEGTLGFDLGAGVTGAASAGNATSHPPASAVSLTPRNNAPVAASVTLPRLDLLLTFDTDSASLTDQGTANAMAFAEALKRPELKQARFEIEGHTDATGTHEHNLALSERRAQAVKAFLTSHGVEAERLNAVGYASDRLAVPDQPASRANRRVVARRLQ